MLKAYAAIVAILFGTLSLGLYYDRKLIAAKLKAAEEQTQSLTAELNGSVELVAKLRSSAEQISKAHIKTYKQLQALEKEHANAERKLNELRSQPEFKAWADADIHIDADNWLRQLHQAAH